MASPNANANTNYPDPIAQKAIIEKHLVNKLLVEGENWYIVLSEWLEHLKRYVGFAGPSRYYHGRPPPGPVVTRRDFAHNVEIVHEDAWRLCVQWYGLAEGHKPMKLVVYNYSGTLEIEHNLNTFKVMLCNAPIEEFQNLRFSKMEKVGHVEWKIREHYRVPKAETSRLWGRADVDKEWIPMLNRDKAMGKVLEIDSDFTRSIVALEIGGRGNVWNNQPQETDNITDFPIGQLYEHNIFEDVATTWEVDVHDQIDIIGKGFLDRLHVNFGTFVQRAKDYVDERENNLRERERDISEREVFVERQAERLVEKERKLTEDNQSIDAKINDFEIEKDKREREFSQRVCDTESTLKIRQEQLTFDRSGFTKDQERFHLELKRMSELYAIQNGKVRLDIGGHQFTTSNLTLSRDSESMLAAMFSGRHELKSESDGSYFIDRDGTHFRYILNYLRDGCVKEGTLPQNENVWRELLTEAEYFQLAELVEYLNNILYRKEVTKETDTFV